MPNQCNWPKIKLKYSYLRPMQNKGVVSLKSGAFVILGTGAPIYLYDYGWKWHHLYTLVMWPVKNLWFPGASWRAQFEDEFPARVSGFGHLQQLEVFTPQYYCFHPGTLCKHVYLHNLRLNCQRCPKPLTRAGNSSSNWAVQITRFPAILREM